MNEEGQGIEKKSIKVVMGKAADWMVLAKDSICYAK